MQRPDSVGSFIIATCRLELAREITFVDHRFVAHGHDIIIRMPLPPLPSPPTFLIPVRGSSVKLPVAAGGAAAVAPPPAAMTSRDVTAPLYPVPCMPAALRPCSARRERAYGLTNTRVEGGKGIDCSSVGGGGWVGGGGGATGTSF